MARGIKLKTPTDPDERKRYKERRAANNKAAQGHRERTRLMVQECKELREKYDDLKTAFDFMKERLAEVEQEKDVLLNTLLTHECVSSTEHREQLYATFSRSKPAARNTLQMRSHQSSPARIEPSIYQPPAMPNTHKASAPGRMSSPYNKRPRVATATLEQSYTPHDSNSSRASSTSIQSPDGSYMPQMDLQPYSYSALDGDVSTFFPLQYSHPIPEHHSILGRDTMESTESAAGSTSSYYSPQTLGTSYQDEIDDRPSGFFMDTFTPREKPSKEVEAIQKLVDTKNTGFTPAPGHYTPLGEDFLAMLPKNNATAAPLPVLPVNDVSDTLSPMFEDLRTS